LDKLWFAFPELESNESQLIFEDDKVKTIPLKLGYILMVFFV
jgi:hypothetical protein